MEDGELEGIQKAVEEGPFEVDIKLKDKWHHGNSPKARFL